MLADRSCALALLALASCSHPPRVPDMLSPPATRGVLSALGAVPTSAGSARILYGRTSCQWDGPNPVIVLPRKVPMVGRELVVRWQLSVVPPPPRAVDANGDTSPPIVVVLGSTRPLQQPIAAGEIAPGCMLLVNPDYTLAPADGSWITYDKQTGIVEMRWTPAPGTEGMDFFSQLLVAMPGANPIGLISSAGLQIHVGSQ